MAGLFLLGSVFGVLMILLPVALVLGLIILLALRGEPDDGGRGITLYLVLATFVGFLTLLLGVTAFSAAVTDLVAGDDDESISVGASDDFGTGSSVGSGSSFGGEDTGGIDVSPAILERGGQSHDDRAWTTIIQTVIVMLAALVVLLFHWPRLEAVGRRATSGSAALKVRQAYCYSVCFVVVVTLLVSVSVALFTVVQAIAPGTTGAEDSGEAIKSFVPVFVLAVGAAALFAVHWSRVDTPAFLQPPPPAAEDAVA